jgi:hypothetical protein
MRACLLCAGLCAAAVVLVGDALPIAGGGAGVARSILGAGDHEAEATVSVLFTLEELVDRSDSIAVVQALERFSQWEEVAGSRRIVTYTKLSVSETMAGAEAEEVWVRTLGGKVGKIGQHVAGEAQFTIGERAVVFLAKIDDVHVVTGMAQGHFPLVDADGVVRLKSSPDTGSLVHKRGPRVSAREKLVGAKLTDATRDIKAASASAPSRKANQK